jgi:hypothetical protein
MNSGLRHGVIVLGMHRSGTSCLAGCLQERGLFLGEVFEKNPYNLKGNRENQSIMQLNISVLESSGGNWNRPPEEIIWNESQARERDQIIASFMNSGEQTWGFKDPRTLLSLPFWEAGLKQISFVGTFRNPIAVAKSLNSRDGMPIEEGLALWRAYNQKLVSLWCRQPFPMVSFDSNPCEYRDSIDRTAKFLGLETRSDSIFFEENLRHQSSGIEAISTLNEADRSLYLQLCSLHFQW